MLNKDYAKNQLIPHITDSSMFSNVILNDYGYYNLKQLPTDEEREAYYKDKYYQNGCSSFSESYNEDELKFFKSKLEQKLLLIKVHLDIPPAPTFLDIGCGEGFAVKFFSEKGFEVTGLDYSSAGALNQNPDILDKIILGDIYDNIGKILLQHKCFDIINMDNVLEHVVDPKALLLQANKLMNENGVMIIKVPNDFSVLQKYLFEEGVITKAHWVAPLDHISYFNKNGLINLCRDTGFVNVDILGNYMVEFFALNPNTNYYQNPSVGKSCHFARVKQENIFNDISPAKTIELYRVLGEMGLGREIIGVFKKQ